MCNISSDAPCPWVWGHGWCASLHATRYTLYAKTVLLSIDTSGSTGTVALARLEDGELEILAQTGLPGKTYSAQLVPAIVEP